MASYNPLRCSNTELLETRSPPGRPSDRRVISTASIGSTRVFRVSHVSNLSSRLSTPANALSAGAYRYLWAPGNQLTSMAY